MSRSYTEDGNADPSTLVPVAFWLVSCAILLRHGPSRLDLPQPQRWWSGGSDALQDSRHTLTTLSAVRLPIECRHNVLKFVADVRDGDGSLTCHEAEMNPTRPRSKSRVQIEAS
jgi:hypothetical protein